MVATISKVLIIISPSPSASARNALKGFNVSAQEKSAIVKADRDPAIVAALDNFADLTSQRHLGSPGESLSDQPDLIANFETGPQLRFLLHFALAFSPCSTRRVICLLSS